MTKKRKRSIALGIAVVLLFIVSAFLWQQLSGSKEGELDPESSASYDIQVILDDSGQFRIGAEIDVVNESEEPWETLGFYFIPNALNSEETPTLTQDSASTAISSVSDSGQSLSYELENNRLIIELEEKLLPGERQRVKIDYTLRLPMDGLRLSQEGGSYFLAQWYPMLSFYQDGWNIEEYETKGESYHTSYGTYRVTYDLPKDFFVASSADDGDIQTSSSGTVEGENIKDFYMAFMDPKKWITDTRKANDTTLRMFLPKGSDIAEETAKMAVEAYTFFEENIGDNPSSELDIIANDGYMEYPNAIEVASDLENLEDVLVHEIGHQWFYYLVANDPFEDAWLDESITEYVTSLFLSHYYDDEDYGFESEASMSEYAGTNRYSNLPLDQYEETEYVTTIYGKTPAILRNFFNERGGPEEAFDFLAAYYKEYQFKNVNTETFKGFFNEYYGDDYSEFFDEWLK